MVSLVPGEFSVVSESVRVLLAPNPGPMSLDGTQSYVLGPDGDAIVVDPGPLAEAHLGLLASTEPRLILITHHHADHTAGALRLHELTGAPVRAGAPQHSHGGDGVLREGETFEAPGLRIRALHTPGHTSDSFSFVLTTGAGKVSVITGDTILGRGTTMIDFPDGTLSDYLTTLDRYAGLAQASETSVTTLPAHGGLGADLAGVVNQYREHRLERLAQVSALAGKLGYDVDALTAAIYADVPEGARRAARLSVQAQVDYLQRR